MKSHKHTLPREQATFIRLKRETDDVFEKGNCSRKGSRSDVKLFLHEVYSEIPALNVRSNRSVQ